MTITYVDNPKPISAGLIVLDPLRGTPLRVIGMQFNPTYRRQPMAPLGSSSAATTLTRMLPGPDGSLDRTIARRITALRSSGVSQGLLSGDLRDNPQWQRMVTLVSRERREGRRRNDRQRTPHDTRSFRSLERLSKLQDADRLANREIAAVRAWIYAVGAMDFAVQRNEAQTRIHLFEQITARLERAWPWWDSDRMRGRIR